VLNSQIFTTLKIPGFLIRLLFRPFGSRYFYKKFSELIFVSKLQIYGDTNQAIMSKLVNTKSTKFWESIH